MQKYANPLIIFANSGYYRLWWMRTARKRRISMLLANVKVVSDIERLRRSLIIGAFILLSVFAAVEALRGHQHWNHVVGGAYSLWNYISSLVYFTSGLLSLGCGILVHYLNKLDTRHKPSRSWKALIAAGAGFVFFATDKALALHVKLGVLLVNSVSWLNHMQPSKVDGIISVCYGLGAIAFSVPFIREKYLNRQTKTYFLWGFILMAIAFVMDATEDHPIINPATREGIQQIIKLGAGWAFAAAFLTFASYLLIIIITELGISQDRTPAKTRPSEPVSSIKSKEFAK